MAILMKSSWRHILLTAAALKSSGVRVSKRGAISSSKIPENADFCPSFLLISPKPSMCALFVHFHAYLHANSSNPCRVWLFTSLPFSQPQSPPKPLRPPPIPPPSTLPQVRTRKRTTQTLGMRTGKQLHLDSNEQEGKLPPLVLGEGFETG